MLVLRRYNELFGSLREFVYEWESSAFVICHAFS